VRTPRHGTPGEYTNHHCRCSPCRDAWAICCRRAHQDRTRALDGEHRTPPRRGPTGLQEPAAHNRHTYSNWGCRCPECTSDWATYWRGHRQQLREASA